MHLLQLLLHVSASSVAALQLQHMQGTTAAEGWALESAVRQRQYAMLHAHLRPKVSLLDAGTVQTEAAADASELHNLAGLTGTALGLAASMSESGYRAVASAKSRLAMKSYVTRVLAKEHLVLTKPSDLEGVLPYYDGECARQSFSNLVAELRRGTVKHGCREPWIAHKDGATLLQMEANEHIIPKDLQGVPSAGVLAPLSEQGYQAVASTKNNTEMIAFIKRVMLRDGLRVQKMDGLNGFVPYYSGECATQSFDALVTEIHHAAPTSVAANVTFQFKQKVSVEQLKKALAMVTNVDESLILISEVAAQETNSSANATPNEGLNGQDKNSSANVTSSSVSILNHDGFGNTVALDEDGYQEVAKLKNNEEMKAFMRRLVNKSGHAPMDESALSGMVHFYSGAKAVQSLAKLTLELNLLAQAANNSEMVVIDFSKQKVFDNRATLDEDGYQEVAKLKNNEAMKLFMRRLLASKGQKLVDEAVLSGIVDFYSGTKAVQSLASLTLELNSVGRIVPLTEAGYKEVANQKDDVEMKRFARRLSAAEGLDAPKEATLDGIIPYYSGTRSVQSLALLRHELTDTPWKHRKRSKKAANPAGNSNTMANPTGSMKRPSKMQANSTTAMTNAKMVGSSTTVLNKSEKVSSSASVATADLTYEDLAGAVNAFVINDLETPAKNSSKQDGLGNRATLDEAGYQEVAKLKNNEEMKIFMRRLVNKSGHAPMDESALSGMVHFYSGAKAVQSLANLSLELNLLAQTANDSEIFVGNFSSQKSPENMTTLDEDGYQEMAKLKNNDVMKSFMRRLLASKGQKLVDEAVLSGIVDFYSGTRAVQSLESLNFELSSVGRTVPLTDAGYKEVARLKDDMQMKRFARRLSAAEGLDAPEEATLDGIIPFYSGTRSVQSLESLRRELIDTPWKHVKRSKKLAHPATAMRKRPSMIRSMVGMNQSETASLNRSKKITSAAGNITAAKANTSLMHSDNVEKSPSQIMSASISIRDPVTLARIRLALQNMTAVQAHLDVPTDVKKNEIPSAVPEAACGSGWVA